jgi:hypothetical protein
MKSIIQKIVNLYAANGKFHSFVESMALGLGAGISAALAAGVPLNKQGWVVGSGLVLGAVKGALTGWLRNNVASTSLQGGGGPPVQTDPKH